MNALAYPVGMRTSSNAYRSLLPFPPLQDWQLVHSALGCFLALVPRQPHGWLGEVKKWQQIHDICQER